MFLKTLPPTQYTVTSQSQKNANKPILYRWENLLIIDCSQVEWAARPETHLDPRILSAVSGRLPWAPVQITLFHVTFLRISPTCTQMAMA